MMKVVTYPLGSLQANCYLVWNENHVLIVDPGGTSKKIIARVDFFAKHFNCNVYISEEDSKFLYDSKLNCSDMMDGAQITHNWEPLQMHMELGKFSFDVLNAPGHTNGSSLLVFDTFILSGDVLFKGSVGRCDLPTGSNAKMSQTIQMIKTLNPDMVVYPGHGPATTIQEELLNNPFFQ